MALSDLNTNESVRDDLDNYGDHLPVVIEDLSGRLHEVGGITSRTVAGGYPVIVIEVGDRADFS